MIQNKKRIISLILMLTLLVSSLVVGAITASATGTGDKYVKVTEAPDDWSGTYLIVYEAGNVAFNGALTTLDAVSNTISVSIFNGEITANDATNAAAFTIAKNGSNYTIKSASGKYIGQTSNSNGLASGASAYNHTLSINEDKTVNFVSGGAYLRFNAASNQNRFRYYKSSSYSGQKAICLYKLVEGSSSGCSHNYVNETITAEPTCTEAGGKTSTCSLCGDVKTEIIPSTGHSYGEFETTKEASCTKNGTKTRTCATCGDEDKQTIPSTGHTQGEEVKTVDATCINAGYTVYSCSTCKENYEVEGEAALGHSGHDVCTRCCEVNAAWTLVTDASSLKIGDQIIIVASGNFNYALSTTQNGNNRAQASVTKNGNTVTFGVDVQIITLEAGLVDDTFAFNVGNGYLYAASSGSNHLKTQETLNNNGSWAIEISASGVATIKAQGTNTRNWLRYNSTNNPPIFSCYSSGQADISIYKAPANSGKQHSDSCGHVAEVNGEVYTSIKDAIDNAESGTITLIDDVTYDGTLAITNENIVIDLNGHNLVADGIVTFGYGVQIVDSGATKGLIDVDRDKLVFAPLVDEKTGKETPATSTEIVPVWNGEGYVIADVTDQYKPVASDAENKFIIDFKPKFDGVAHSYVKGGETATGLTFEVRITGGDFDKTYTVTDDIIAQAYAGKSVRLNLINAKEGITYTVQLIIKSECDLHYVGELGQYTYTVPADAE